MSKSVVRRQRVVLAAVVLCLLGMAGCTTPTTNLPVDGDPVIAAAGDISCDPTAAPFKGGQGTKTNCHENITADEVLAGSYAAVLALGDTQYECGDASAYAQSYEPSWGKVKAITKPVIGNHEYGKACGRNDPTPYFNYFGDAAHGPGGYYSFDIGTWHVIVLNSECNSGKGAFAVGGCKSGSPQETWLLADLASHQTACTLAAWHEPRFSSGEHGDAEQTADLWNDLARAHADIVLSGHNHDYERFDPLGVTPALPYKPDTPDEKGQPVFQQPMLDQAGIRQFVVGTGGKNHYDFPSPPLTGEQVRNGDTYGLLALTLHPTSYDWKFVPEPGHTFTDAGTGSCH